MDLSETELFVKNFIPNIKKKCKKDIHFNNETCLDIINETDDVKMMNLIYKKCYGKEYQKGKECTMIKKYDKIKKRTYHNVEYSVYSNIVVLVGLVFIIF